MKKFSLLAGMAITMMALSACNDDILDIGTSLTSPADKLTVSSAQYNVQTRTVLADSVLLRSSYCYLGRVKDPETNAYITSEFMTQFNLLESFSLPAQSTFLSRDAQGLPAADSCQVELYMEKPTAITDTLAALKIRLSEMARPMEENRRYYSNFDPVEQGYLRTGGIAQDKMFAYNDHVVADDVRNASNYYNVINIQLNRPYTDAQGVTYSNYGTYIIQKYFAHPEYFRNAYSFIHNVCPGFYVSVIDGEGVYTEIPDMCLRVYYKVQEGDSVYNRAAAFAGTEEVLQTAKITNQTESLQELMTDNTCTYMKAPAGLYTEVTLPIDDIYSQHAQDSIMTASISFQRVNNDYTDLALRVPSYMLMVPKDSLSTFFDSKKAPDNKTTFYTSCLTNSVNKQNTYTFSNISSLVTHMANLKRRGVAADPNWVASHPNWNKVLLVPVQIVTSSSTTTTVSTASSSFEHCMAIASTKLVGGSENPFAPIRINIVYSKFNQ